MVSRSTSSFAARAQALANLKKLLSEIDPTAQPDVLLAEDTKFGIMDQFFFDKAKPDRNGVYANIKLIKQSFNSMKEMIQTFQASPAVFHNVQTLAYKPVNDKYHYILVRKININKDNLEKYLLLI